jgi:hypothetical protein
MLLRRQPSNGASTSTSSSSLPSTPRPLDGGQFTARGEHQSRHMRTPVAAPACMLRADCGLVTSLATTDLRDELDCLHSGEDDRTTIEHWRERRCNLDDDYCAPIAAPAGRTTHPPSSPGVVGRCMTLTPHCRMVVWPRKFQPHMREKYDGFVNTTELL